MCNMLFRNGRFVSAINVPIWPPLMHTAIVYKLLYLKNVSNLCFLGNEVPDCTAVRFHRGTDTIRTSKWKCVIYKAVSLQLDV